MIVIVNGGQIARHNPARGQRGFTAVDSGEGFFTVSADISALGSTAITNIRFDPIGGQGTFAGTFNLDCVRVNAVPEPGSLALRGLGVWRFCSAVNRAEANEHF